MGFNQVTRGPALVGEVAFVDAGVSMDILRTSITAPADGSEQDTGLDIPDNCIVTDVFLNVKTAEATGTTKTIDVGLLSGESNGDADGFLVGADVSGTGIVQGTLDSAGQTLGALLTADEGGTGELVPEPHVKNVAESVSFTAGSADFAELEADIYVVLLKLN